MVTALFAERIEYISRRNQELLKITEGGGYFRRGFRSRVIPVQAMAELGRLIRDEG